MNYQTSRQAKFCPHKKFTSLHIIMSVSPACAMLTDLYQITITRSYFKEKRHEEPACFDLFYREQPFCGSFAIFAGLEEAITVMKEFRFSDPQLDYLKSVPGLQMDEAFLEYLRNIDMSKLKITAFPEGSVVFPREPLLRIEGPLGLCQLAETPLLNAINFPTLMTTNAMRFKLRAGNAIVMEFGLRRAQGPDGALSASRYSYVGGFDSTSNVLAGMMYGIPVAGTVAHSFISSFTSLKQLDTTKIAHKETGAPVDLLECAQRALKQMGCETTESELAAFLAQAMSYPNAFMGLVDTYSTLKSGVPNFLAVAYGLHEAGYKAIGVRLDSGDLATLSKQVRQLFVDFSKKFGIEYAAKFNITASDSINEDELERLAREGHEINAFGIGTHLVTCQRQPALGGVYKLVEIMGQPRVKVSNCLDKATLPAKKDILRLYDDTGKEIADLLVMAGETVEPGEISGFEVYPDSKPVTVKAAQVKPMLVTAWENGVAHVDSVQQARERVINARKTFNPDIMSVTNDKLYSVMVSKKLHDLLMSLMSAVKF